MELKSRQIKGTARRSGSYRILAPRPWGPKRFEAFGNARDKKDSKYQPRRNTAATTTDGTDFNNQHTLPNGVREPIADHSFEVFEAEPDKRENPWSKDAHCGPEGHKDQIGASNSDGLGRNSLTGTGTVFQVRNHPLPFKARGQRNTWGHKSTSSMDQRRPKTACTGVETPISNSSHEGNTGRPASSRNFRNGTGITTNANVNRGVPPPTATVGPAGPSSSMDLKSADTSCTSPRGRKRVVGRQSTSAVPDERLRNELLATVREGHRRSASVSEAEIRIHAKRAAGPTKAQVASRNLANMMSRKWTDEREGMASAINLTQPNDTQQGNCSDRRSLSPKNDCPEMLPNFETKDALNCASLRLRRVCQELAETESDQDPIIRALKYAISVLEMRYLSEGREDHDDHLTLQGDEVVAPEIKRWLMQTFSTTETDNRAKRANEKRTLRSVVHVMQAGMFVERMFRKSSAAASLSISPEIQAQLKDIDKYSFDVFELDRISGGNALKFVMHEALHKYDFLAKFKISSKTLFSYCDRLQNGYKKHNNRYHNPIHAADVTQCLFYFLNESGFLNWLTDLEVFAIIFAGAIHDVEHTGTTNNFHTQTRSDLALLYNDKSVLENHHASTAFRILWNEPECDILSSLSKDDYRQFRALVIDMVLATDMSLHFGQIKNMKSTLLHPENIERSKVMSMMMHCADISHPTRRWELHHRWTARLIEEFFEQGDRERKLEVPISPLCDRHSTMIAQSQIGFLDYVIIPTFEVLGDVFWEVNASLNGDTGSNQSDDVASTSKAASPDRTTKVSEESTGRRFSDGSPLNDDKFRRSAAAKKRAKEFRKLCNNNTKQNRQKWVEKDEIEREARDAATGSSSHDCSGNDVSNSPAT